MSSASYNLCVECGQRAYRDQHSEWRIRRGEGHRFVDPRRQVTPPPVRTLSRFDLEREGWVEVSGPHPDMAVGDRAVVYARGDRREGRIRKIGRTTVYVSVATPTSPDLVTDGKIGGAYRQRGYILPKVPR